MIWNQHDLDIERIVSAYNRYLGSIPGYMPLDWHLVKAMVWTETGPVAPGNEWNTMAMQSANPGDSGFPEMMSKPDRTNLIVPPALRSAVSSPNSNAHNNIAAGVGYLLYSASNFGQKTIADKKNLKKVTVAKGDTLEKLAAKFGTTAQVLQQDNPGVSPKALKPGMVLAYSPATVATAIKSWKSVTPSSAAAMYNGHGDPAYADKLSFFYQMINSNKALQ